MKKRGLLVAASALFALCSCGIQGTKYSIAASQTQSGVTLSMSQDLYLRTEDFTLVTKMAYSFSDGFKFTISGDETGALFAIEGLTDTYQLVSKTISMGVKLEGENAASYNSTIQSAIVSTGYYNNEEAARMINNGETIKKDLAEEDWTTAYVKVDNETMTFAAVSL